MDKKELINLIDFTANGVCDIHITKKFPKAAEEYLYSHFESTDIEVKEYIIEIMHRIYDIVNG